MNQFIFFLSVAGKKEGLYLQRKKAEKGDMNTIYNIVKTMLLYLLNPDTLGLSNLRNLNKIYNRKLWNA